MSSISINPATLCVELNCTIGEFSATFDAEDIYAAWKDWFVLSDNSKYPPAMDAAGGADIGGGEKLGRAFFIRNDLGWRLAPVTVETPVDILLTGNIFPSGSLIAFTLYTYSAGNTHIERRTSSLPSVLETGVSGLTSAEATMLAAIDTSVDELATINGLTLGSPVIVTPSSRVAGIVSQTITGDGETTTTVTRDP